MLEVGRHVVLMSILAIVLQFRMFVYSQDSIAFSPDRAPCMGERVEMVCYVEPPPSETFAFTLASVSFNGSSPATLAQINADETVGGIDLTRYSANTDGLTTSAARPAIRLVIDSYLPSDSDTLFGCHGAFPNTSASDAIVSGMIMGQADPISALGGTTTIIILSNSSIRISFSATQITSNRLIGLTYTFTLNTKSAVLAKANVTDSQSPNIKFPATFISDFCYQLSVSVENCANVNTEGAASDTNFNLRGLSDSTGGFSISSANSSRIVWKYSEDVECLNDNTNISLAQGLFTLTLLKDNIIVYNISEITLYLPQGFDFYIPMSYYQSTSEYFLRIKLFGQKLTEEDIPIIILSEADCTVTCILGALFGLLILLFIIIVLLILLFLAFFFYKKRQNHKK